MKLRTEPSFSIYNSNDGVGENGDEDFEEKLERTVTTVKKMASLGSREFSFGSNSMDLIEEGDSGEDDEERTSNQFKGLGVIDETRTLTPGLGVDGGGVGYELPGFDDNCDLEVYYKRMIRDDPSNPLFLRNYAKLLQSKGDYSGAEDYYYRAALADPKDGEIMLQYAKLVRDFHHDKGRAISYFERAAQASPEDSHVLAAYASFLWEIDEDEDEGSCGSENKKIEDGIEMDLHNLVVAEDKRPSSPPLHLATGLGIDMSGFGGSIGTFDYLKTDFGNGANAEEYYKMMAQDNTCNPLFLRNYAQFLSEIKGDLEAAEECYSKAVLADPSDGDILAQYAKLIWHRHKDGEKASLFFEQAVQVAPEDSNVLAAYARFLWESEEENNEEDCPWNNQIHVPIS